MVATYVLVHGGLHGSWCWRRVVGPLGDAGHAVDAVDLPGRGGTVGGGLEAYERVVAEAVDRARPPVILVGHSLGGVAVSKFVQHRPDAVARLVLVNALLVEDGEAALPKLQTAGEECAFLRPGALVFSDDGNSVSVAPSFVVDGFYNHCSAADAEWASARLCAESVAPLMVPLRVTVDGFGSVPKIYLGSRGDRVLPWWFQVKMSKAAGAQFVELHGDHSPFLSVPHELVARLLEIDVTGESYG
jgi:pimeloyl-ACP methyl ester carboxylesterase